MKICLLLLFAFYNLIISFFVIVATLKVLNWLDCAIVAHSEDGYYSKNYLFLKGIFKTLYILSKQKQLREKKLELLQFL